MTTEPKGSGGVRRRSAPALAGALCVTLLIAAAVLSRVTATWSAAVPVCQTMSAQGSSTWSSAWRSSNARDRNRRTAWASAGHPSPEATEWLAFGFGPGTVDSVQLTVPKPSGRPASWPGTLTVDYSTGAAWVPAPLVGGHQGTVSVSRAETATLSLPLAHPVLANGFLITATNLPRMEASSEYALQLAEVSVSCAKPGSWSWLR
ncbi:discoidin domain-containing protein [Acidiferrimicrobium sp. IK]|uniref:discoidin domain-containing protein n=1 Tax=Acidiferrimicrobium sp. IK TaxID=2871700 RepID=UPI0021CAEAF1|nr:discoidin domain-containing protein [Acidiferrimicrobium sp. IK]MCU4183939.1 discoidin domain-containing protein [Acidiferrimicrobium sp. IK]